MSLLSSEFKISVLAGLMKSAPDKFEILLKNETDKKVLEFFKEYKKLYKIANDKI